MYSSHYAWFLREETVFVKRSYSSLYVEGDTGLFLPYSLQLKWNWGKMLREVVWKLVIYSELAPRLLEDQWWPLN